MIIRVGGFARCFVSFLLFPYVLNRERFSAGILLTSYANEWRFSLCRIELFARKRLDFTGEWFGSWPGWFGSVSEIRWPENDVDFSKMTCRCLRLFHVASPSHRSTHLPPTVSGSNKIPTYFECHRQVLDHNFIFYRTFCLPRHDSFGFVFAQQFVTWLRKNKALCFRKRTCFYAIRWMSKLKKKKMKKKKWNSRLNERTCNTLAPVVVFRC